MKSVLLASICMFCSSNIWGQELVWEYGLNTNFNVSMIKPVATDSFGNKAGFGGGLFLEASKGNFSVQLSPSYAKTSFIHDKTLTTYHINSLDISTDLIYTPTPASDVFFVAGVCPAFSLSYIAKSLDGSKATGSTQTILEDLPTFELGAKIGISLKLNDGIRFNSNYYEFFNGSLKDGLVKGRADYIQFGLGIRFNEYINGEKSETKRIRLEAESAAKDFHLNALRTSSTLVFVLPNSAAGNSSEKIKEQEEITRNWLISAIYNNYHAGAFQIISGEDLGAALKGDSISVFAQDSTTDFVTLPPSYYVARIGEFFIDNNSKLSWGIMMYNAQMNALKYPFPSYIPYRNIDNAFKNEASIVRMISELNASLTQ